jgi:hypothetical protein
MAAGPSRGAGSPVPDTLRNQLYQIRVLKDASILLVNRDGSQRRFMPRFTVLFRPDDPGLKEFLDPSVNFIVPSWNVLPVSVDPSTKGAPPAPGKPSRTVTYFASGKISVISAGSFTLHSRVLSWNFPSDSLFDLRVSITLPPGEASPKVSFAFTPRREGWYSIGYTGAPDIDQKDAANIWQPLVWQERRFPDSCYLSMEHMCPIPATMVEQQGVVTSVITDPSEVPFRMPTFDNARFGVLVRNREGAAQPQVFAPVMGGQHSRMRAGGRFTFSFRLLTRKGNWLDTYQYMARSVYGFHDYRQNATASLNETIDNMVDFAMNDAYSGWNAELKAFDYSTDVKGSVKLVSALHPLSIALIKDDPGIYKRRALPMIEYLMSREKYLFTLDEREKSQSPSHFLRGPAAGVSELTALYGISQGRSPVFKYYADSLYDRPRTLNLGVSSAARRWQDVLALYEMTGERHLLDTAVSGAEQYIKSRIDKPQADFSDAGLSGAGGGQFWTDFSPKWFDLLELYEQTSDKRFLDAAAYGAKIYATYAWMQPAVPDSEVLINPHGVLPMGDPWSKKDPRPMDVSPLRVPAWRVSQVGLTPEASNTYNVNPAVLLTTYAAFMLRLAYYTGDSFLKDIARSAVVGRYTNYPGYDINMEYTNLYQRPDYPLRDFQELTYNQIYYNHVWPHIALLMDYLVTDALYKSGGRINFPSRYAEGYAYLHCKVYGDRAGTFYGDNQVWLWMPKGLLKTDNIQVNYITARGNGNFYLALLNQSKKDQSVRLVLNQDIIPIDLEKRYKVTVWQGNDRVTGGWLEDGVLSLTVKAGGITALRIEGVPIRTRFQAEVFDSAAPALSAGSYAQWPTGFGKVTGMMISMGRSLTSGYIWLDATEKTLRSAVLHYKICEGAKEPSPGLKESSATWKVSSGGWQDSSAGWQEVKDAIYPYEFSIPIKDKADVLEFWIEGLDGTGQNIQSGKMFLKR